MNCPACNNPMSEHTVNGVTIDVCRDGCGGLWFDNFELDKVDEQFESVDSMLLDGPADPAPVMDTGARRSCPRCEGMVMMRHHVSVRREIEIDECPGCAGTFLDHGELEAIRQQFESQEARSEAAREFFAESFGDRLDEVAAESEADVRRARKFAGMLRLILPSHWLPGKQTWGAF
ncbi:hypothetical protein GF314_15185 [bacterium]|nr:hypothetical protein [bacterium]